MVAHGEERADETDERQIDSRQMSVPLADCGKGENGQTANL